MINNVFIHFSITNFQLLLSFCSILKIVTMFYKFISQTISTTEIGNRILIVKI